VDVNGDPDLSVLRSAVVRQDKQVENAAFYFGGGVMGVYYGTPVGTPPGVITQPVCFTGSHAKIIKTALGLGTGLFGAAIGLIVGLGINIVRRLGLTPKQWFEIATASKAAAPLIGAVLGFLIAYALARSVVKGGDCPTCPAGTEAFCINIYYLQFSIGGQEIPLPFFTSNPTACAIAVAAGCK
jgi:hypothetical protein